ncbi:MAG: MFS transporter [Candidatus Limnocylindrales bacterium]
MSSLTGSTRRSPGHLGPRGRLTWLLFLVGAAGSYLLNGMGAILASIQDERGASRAEVGLYPTLFAAGLIVMGFVADRIIARIDRPVALRLSIVGIIAGAWLLAVPDRTVSSLGAVVMGASGGLMITLTPVIIAALHPRRTVGIFGELQAANSAASVVAPLVIGLALGLGLGWRPAYLLPTLVMALMLPLLAGIPRARRTHHDVTPAPVPRPAAGRARSVARWLDILIAVGAEFCMVFWAASAFRDWHGASDDVAAALTAMFLLGMASARAVATPVTRVVPEAWRLVTGGCLVSLVGFAVFWAGPSIPIAAVGAIVVGLGLGLQYPVLLPLFVSGYPDAPDRAAARGALASGLAIGGAPLVLAYLSDRLGLHEAYLIVPLLLALLAVRVGMRRELGPRPSEPTTAEMPTSA